MFGYPLFGRDKMNNHKILKILIVLEILCGLTTIIIDLSLESYLPQEFQQYIARTKDAELTALQIFGSLIGVVVIVGQIVAWVGLWKLWKHARLLYTICVIIAVPLYLLLEPVVYYTTIGAIFSEIATLAEGIILGLLYFTNMKYYFSKEGATNN